MNTYTTNNCIDEINDPNMRTSSKGYKGMDTTDDGVVIVNESTDFDRLIACTRGVQVYAVTIDGKPDGLIECMWVDNTWVIIRTDDEVGCGDQVGNCDYAPNRGNLAGTLRYMAATSLIDLDPGHYDHGVGRRVRFSNDTIGRAAYDKEMHAAAAAGIDTMANWLISRDRAAGRIAE